MRRMSKALLLIASSCTLSLVLVVATAPTAAATAQASRTVAAKATPKTWVSIKTKQDKKRFKHYLSTGKPGKIIMKVNGRTRAIKHTGANRWVRFGVPRGWLPNCQTSTVTFKMIGHRWKQGPWRQVHVRDSTDCLTQEQKMLRVAKAQVGKPYRYGAAGPSAFDCSGLIKYAYGKVGRYVPRGSTALKNAGQRIPRGKAKPGDLVWTPGHIAIYAGKGRVVESARPGVGVVYRTMWQRDPVFLRI